MIIFNRINNATCTLLGIKHFSSTAILNDEENPAINPKLLLGLGNSAKLSSFDNTEKYRYNQSLSFRDDGSMVLTSGSTTIIKNGSKAVIKGGLINKLDEDSSQNVTTCQLFFSNALKNLKSTYNINKEIYEESIPIKSIKYIKTCKMLVEEVLED